MQIELPEPQERIAWSGHLDIVPVQQRTFSVRRTKDGVSLQRRVAVRTGLRKGMRRGTDLQSQLSLPKTWDGPTRARFERRRVEVIARGTEAGIPMALLAERIRGGASGRSARLSAGQQDLGGQEDLGWDWSEADEPVHAVLRKTEVIRGVLKVKDQPLVEIHDPDVTPLEALIKPKDRSEYLRAHAKESDYFLVILRCTLYTQSQSHFTRAKLSAELRGARDARIIAAEIYPEDVNDDQQVSFALTLAPKVSVGPVAVEGLTLSFTAKDYILRPLIHGEGGGGARAFWYYTAQRGKPLEGDKRMYLVVQAPKGTPAASVLIDLESELAVDGWFHRLQGNLPPPAHQSYPLWGDQALLDPPRKGRGRGG